MGTSEFNAEEQVCNGLASHPGGGRNTPSCLALEKKTEFVPAV